MQLSSAFAAVLIAPTGLVLAGLMRQQLGALPSVPCPTPATPHNRTPPAPATTLRAMLHNHCAPPCNLHPTRLQPSLHPSCTNPTPARPHCSGTESRAPSVEALSSQQAATLQQIQGALEVRIQL